MLICSKFKSSFRKYYEPQDLALRIEQPIVAGRLVRRYKRFLADIRLDDGTLITAHCPNSGAMTGCAIASSKVYLTVHSNPKRKLKYTRETVRSDSSKDKGGGIQISSLINTSATV